MNFREYSIISLNPSSVEKRGLYSSRKMIR
nr:MAG TPA_asm: hypothetical protein [Caudoviricetes sp.]